MPESRDQKFRHGKHNVHEHKDSKARSKQVVEKRGLKVPKYRQERYTQNHEVQHASGEHRLNKHEHDYDEQAENRDPNIPRASDDREETFSFPVVLDYRWEAPPLPETEKNRVRKTRKENWLKKSKVRDETELEESELKVEPFQERNSNELCERAMKLDLLKCKGESSQYLKSQETQQGQDTRKIAKPELKNGKRRQRRDLKVAEFNGEQEFEKLSRRDEVEDTRVFRDYKSWDYTTKREHENLKRNGEDAAQCSDRSRGFPDHRISKRSEQNCSQTTRNFREPFATKKNNVNKRKEFCRDFHYRGSCTFGNQCRYIHTKTDLADTAHFLICLYWHTDLMSLNKKIPYFQGKDGYQSYFFISADMIPYSNRRPPVFAAITAASFKAENSVPDYHGQSSADIPRPSQHPTSIWTRRPNMYESTRVHQAGSFHQTISSPRYPNPYESAQVPREYSQVPSSAYHQTAASTRRPNTYNCRQFSQELSGSFYQTVASRRPNRYESGNVSQESVPVLSSVFHSDVVNYKEPHQPDCQE